MAGFASNALRFANACIRPFGVVLRRLDRPTRDFDEFVSRLGRMHHDFKTVIDVGVAHGTPALYSSLPKAKFYLVEPVPSMLPVLQRLCTELGNAEYFNVAAGAEDGTVSFFVHDDVSGSSLYSQEEGAVLDGQTVKVPVRRLDGIIPAGFQRPSLLKIDTQGHEIEVLKGSSGLLDQIDVIILETSLMAFRKGAPEICEVIQAVSDLGFRVYDLLEGHSRSLDGALAQVDVAFVRRDSPLRADQRFFNDSQLAEYAAKYAAAPSYVGN